MSDHPEEFQAQELTLLLRELARGESAAGEELMPFLVGELGAIAKGYLRGAPPGRSLQPSALVNEAYLKLFGKGGLAFADRAHFLAIAARAMRQILADRARRRHIRGPEEPPPSLSILEPAARDGAAPVDVLDLHGAIEQLAALDARQAAVVELRFFGGLEVEEVAEALGVSKTTVEREWRFARAWLGSRLQQGREP